jgi:hypothetical protein
LRSLLTVCESAALFILAGDLFPPSWSAQLLSQLLSYVFFIGLFLVFAGEWFFTSVLANDAGLRAVRSLKNNQVMTMVVLMGCNMVRAGTRSARLPRGELTAG